MSAAVWGVVGIAAACLIFLAVMVWGVIGRVKRLTASLRQMQSEVQPLADRIVAEGETAQERLQDLSAAAGRR